MGKILTCLMFIPLAVVTYWELATHCISSPVGSFLIITALVSIVIIFKQDFGEDVTNRYPY